jgi:hypothetical protein
MHMSPSAPSATRSRSSSPERTWCSTTGRRGRAHRLTALHQWNLRAESRKVRHPTAGLRVDASALSGFCLVCDPLALKPRRQGRGAGRRSTSARDPRECGSPSPVPVPDGRNRPGPRGPRAPPSGPGIRRSVRRRHRAVQTPHWGLARSSRSRNVEIAAKSRSSFDEEAARTRSRYGEPKTGRGAVW